MFFPRTYTVESVTSGHPDKVCDQISDAILDAHLAQDPFSRVAMESFGAHGQLVIAGEVTSSAHVDCEAIGRQVYRDIGYADELKVLTNVVKQSPDIAQGVDTGGAGDQGIMYGFASDETPEFLPVAIVNVHRLSSGLERLRREDAACAWILPDGKTQITMRDGKIANVLVSTQHSADVSQEEIRSTLIEKLIRPILNVVPTNVEGPLYESDRKAIPPLRSDVRQPSGRNDSGEDVQIFINPTGSFVLGGFAADSGLTGRKLMVDTYGGLIQHGGGAFSGKDATKVDRSAAYMCRFVAKNLVAQGYAKQCLVSVAYAIGHAEPLMVEAVDENGKSLAPLLAKFDFRPQAIIERLGLRRPIYRQTAAYGHFGKAGLPWEEVELLGG